MVGPDGVDGGSGQFLQTFLNDEGARLGHFLTGAKIGFGVAGITREFVQGELAAGEIRELSTAFSIPPRTVDLCMLRNVSPSAATERFARDVLEKLQGKSVSV